jgi:hypothetical protein
MSGLSATSSGLPPGYVNLLETTLHGALARGQSVTTTVTNGSSKVAVTGSGAYLFNTASVRVGAGADATTFSTSNHEVKDTIALSAAARQSLSSSQIALALMEAAAHPATTADEHTTPEKTSEMNAGQAEAMQVAAQEAVTQAASRSGDNADAAQAALIAQEAAYQGSPAAVAAFQSLLVQGERASPAERFYSTYSDSDNFWTITNDMSNAQKASFKTAFNNQDGVQQSNADHQRFGRFRPDGLRYGVRNRYSSG